MKGAVIKARELDRPEAFGLTRILKSDLYNARITAEQIMQAAERGAEQIRQTAQAEKKTVLDKASLDGYQAGLGKWNDILVQTWQARDDLFKQNETDIIKLAMKVAEKILGEQLKIDPASIISIVREAVRTVRRDRNLVVYVAASDLEQVRKNIETLQPLVGVGRDIEVRSSTAVKPGGCIVESELGVIDAQLETQLDRLEKALTRTAPR